MLHYVRARSAWKACIHLITRGSGSDSYLHHQRCAPIFIHPLLPGRNDSARWKHCWQDDCVCSLDSTADTIRLICGVSGWVHPHHTLPLRATFAGKIPEMPISSHLQVPKFIRQCLMGLYLRALSRNKLCAVAAKLNASKQAHTNPGAEAALKSVGRRCHFDFGCVRSSI